MTSLWFRCTDGSLPSWALHLNEWASHDTPSLVWPWPPVGKELFGEMAKAAVCGLWQAFLKGEGRESESSLKMPDIEIRQQKSQLKFLD